MEGTIVEERPSQQEEEAPPQDDMDGMEGEMESQKSGTPDGMDEGVVEAEDETPTPDVETFEPRQEEDNAQTSGFEA